MTVQDPPQEKEEPRIAVGGGMVVPPQPEEVAYPLRGEQFDVLCEGERITEDKWWRDISIAISATALVGLVGVVATVEWDRALASKRWTVFVSTLVLAVLFLVAAILFVFMQTRLRRQTPSSGYARLKSKIATYFQRGNP
jgi:hypothetical protein